MPKVTYSLKQKILSYPMFLIHVNSPDNLLEK